MKAFSLFVLFTHAFLAFGNCKYFSEKDFVDFAGLSINYSPAMVKLMETKNYDRIFNEQETSYFFEVSIRQKSGRFFNRAEATIELFNTMDEVVYTRSLDKRCWTQNCSISDMAKVLNRLFVKTKQDFPICTN